MNYENICLAQAGAVARITLNRPERRNALSLALMLELIQLLDELDQQREVKVVIVAAAGTVFSAGHDLSELKDRTGEYYARTFGVCTELMRKVASIRQPVIAEVQGTATAAGCQLVATCDLAIAAERATFATPGVRIGLFCSTPMVALSRTVGRKHALEMLLTGAPIDARTAAAWGLVNRVVANEDLTAETQRLAEQIASASGAVLATGKQAFYRQIDLPADEAYDHMTRVMTACVAGADAQEGISAFLEKRPPRWNGATGQA